VNDAVPAPRVLVVGLDPYRVPGPWDPTPVAEAIRVGMAGLDDAGFAAEACLVGLDGSEDVAATVSAALASHPGSVSSSAAACATRTSRPSSSRPSSAWYDASRPRR